MAKNNFYAVVLTDGTKSICDTWDKAKTLIASCPKNALYKGFKTKDEAEAFIANPTYKKPEAEKPVYSDTPNNCTAYVDGSFNAVTGVWGSGVILFDNSDPDNRRISKDSGTDYAEQRNVTGEIQAAMTAAEYAARHGYKEITIYHDYQGIASWVTGEWKANNEQTRLYRAAMLSCDIDIKFVKVKGHSGDELNEAVDRIAKEACGVI